jgi:nitrite reductase (NADH) large subunit
MQKYIIVGCGVAGISAAASIRKLDPDGEINIFTEESYPFYTRIRLPELIAGEISWQKLIVYPPEWYAEKKININLAEPVNEINPQDRYVKTPKGNYPYDRLLLATGSHPFVPPIAGMDKGGVFTLRSIKDALVIREHARSGGKALLIGGGLLGLEAGNGLRKAGMEVSVIENLPRLLPRQMDSVGAEILRQQLKGIGFRFYLGSQTKELLGKGTLTGILLADSRRLEGEMVLISAGVRPNFGLAKTIGLKIGKGVLVNDRLQTSIDNIFAAGDLVEHRGVFYGIWPASQKQGEVAGINMAGGDALYEGTVPSNVLKVVGIDLVSAGEFDEEGKFEALVKKDESKYLYRKLILKEDIIIGCILLGDIRGKKEILTAIEQKKNVGAYKTEIVKDDFDFAKLK